MHQLVSAGEAAPDLGFMARTMALCSLPRSNPGNRHQYKRVNGPFTLYMVAGGGNKLPFGNLPRLLLAWVCTEAVRKGCGCYLLLLPTVTFYCCRLLPSTVADALDRG